jgi:selenide,water dikinase
VDDPFTYGSIAVANSLSDIYAMGGRPLLGLNLVSFPVDLSKDILATILKGGYAKAQEAGCLLVGGHTVDDKEPKYGLAAIGLVAPGKQVTNAGARPSDALVLTKPIGTGIITTAAKQGVCDADTLAGAVRWMEALNAAACQAMVEVGVHACTDVTGFGLIGHLQGMVAGSGVGARIGLSAVPVLPGARELLAEGVAPGGTHRNHDSVGQFVDWGDGVSKEDRLLLCDAQTSGGLLISVAPDKLDALLTALARHGVEVRAVIGQMTAKGGRIEVVG